MKRTVSQTAQILGIDTVQVMILAVTTAVVAYIARTLKPEDMK